MRTVRLNLIVAFLFCALAVFVAGQSTPPPDVMTPETNASIALIAYKSWLETEIGKLKAQQDLDRSAFAASLARDANSLQSCPTGQTCSFTLPACDISGVWKADLNNGPTQPSADPTFTCKAGWMQPGERLYYTQYVPLAGFYTVSASTASVP